MNKMPKITISLFLIVVVFAFSNQISTAKDLRSEPIAYIDQGAFFDHSGNQILPTTDFLFAAFHFYEDYLASYLTRKARTNYYRARNSAVFGVKLTADERNLVAASLLQLLLSQTRDLVSPKTINIIQLFQHFSEQNLIPLDSSKMSSQDGTNFLRSEVRTLLDLIEKKRAK